jgi:hypothetical protein
VLIRSGSALATGHKALATREALAERIIAMGRTGERNRERLVNAALVHVASPEMISRKGSKVRLNGNALFKIKPKVPAMDV